MTEGCPQERLEEKIGLNDLKLRVSLLLDSLHHRVSITNEGLGDANNFLSILWA